MDVDRALEIRKPLDDLEAQVVRRDVDFPGEVGPELVGALRYVLSFARLTQVRNVDGVDVDVSGALDRHRWRVLEALRPHLDGQDDRLWSAVRVLPDLVAATRRERDGLLEHFPLDRDSLEAEVTTRPLVVVCGGGGGGGYGYAGAFTLLHQRGLQPALLAGTSIGGLMCMFRARRTIFDGAPMVAASRRLSWNTVFRVLDLDSRYGLPATLRLYLRAAIGSLFHNSEGQGMTFDEMEIPLLIVATGVTVAALKHDLTYYEHFLDDTFRPGAVTRGSGLARVTRVVSIIRELMAEPDSLREVVFGADPLTRQADVLDAAGFSSAIPGIIHYDIYRDDQRMRHLLDDLYGAYGITRLTEGGLVNNLPVRPAFAEVVSGRLGRRNAFVMAMDCFAPTPRTLPFFPLQQIVRPNVNRNLPFANYSMALKRRLSPVNLVPPVHQLIEAMRWTMEELTPDMDYISSMCAPLPVLRGGAHDATAPFVAVAK